MNSPNRLLIAGGIGVVIGAVLPFIMVIGVVGSSLLLNMIAYASSVGGLFLGALGLAGYHRESKRDLARDDEWGDWRP